MQIESRFGMGYYITKASTWHWKPTIIFPLHSSHKSLNGFVVFIGFPCISLYELLETPLVRIDYSIPENILNNFMERALVVDIPDFTHNPRSEEHTSELQS